MTHSKYEQIFGFHAVRQVFENNFSRVVEVWAQAERHDAKLETLLKAAQKQGLAIQRVPKTTLDKLTESGPHQGIMIRCQTRPLSTPTSLEDCLAALNVPPFLLVLDEVQDPHNLGACLRTADAAGIQAVIVPKHRACTLSPTVCKIASGAAETVPVIPVTNLATTLRWLQDQGIWLVGADQNGPSSLFDTRLTGPLAMVLGAEGSGLRRLTREICDVLISIPM